MGEFGRLSPAAFDALLRRKEAAEKRAFLRTGIVAAAIYNANPFRGKDAKPVSPLDFVPGGQPERKQTLAEQVAVIAAAFKCGPKKVKG